MKKFIVTLLYAMSVWFFFILLFSMIKFAVYLFAYEEFQMFFGVTIVKFNFIRTLLVWIFLSLASTLLVGYLKEELE